MPLAFSAVGTVRTARDLAYLTFVEAARTGEFATHLLEKTLDRTRLSEPDRRLAAELVHGVARRQGTLDALVQPLLQRPLSELEDGLRWILRLGAYQLVLLGGIPPHAAVHETIETAKRCGEPRWAGFANGVLRSLARMVTDRTQTHPSADAVPLNDGTYRTLTSPLLPNPASNVLGYFASAFGFPPWLAERWSQRFSNDELIRLGFWFNAPSPLTIRVNTLRTTRDALLLRWREAGITVGAGTQPEMLRLEDRVRVERLPGYDEGEFSVQDESAAGAARLLDPQPSETVLDLCAAPGGKSTHMAELMRNAGRIVAADVDAARVSRIAENAARLGLGIIEPLTIRRDLSDLPPGPFDAVLVDVPCSNTGVLGKRPEARWRLQPADLEELSALQRSLLQAALARTCPGGRVVYSTCSIEPEENAAVVQAVLAGNQEWQLERESLHLPGQPADGAYQARLIRL